MSLPFVLAFHVALFAGLGKITKMLYFSLVKWKVINWKMMT